MRQLSDQQLMGDMLISEKHAASVYNTCTCECATKELQDTMMTILTEEHQIQMDLFGEMQNRGWYKVKPADKAEVEQAKQKFQSQTSGQTEQP